VTMAESKLTQLLKQAFGIGTQRGAAASQRLGNKQRARHQKRFPKMQGHASHADRRATNKQLRDMNRNPQAQTRQNIQTGKFGRHGGNVAGQGGLPS